MSIDPHDDVHRARLYSIASLAFDRPGEELREAFTTGAFADQLVESATAVEDETSAESLADRARVVAEASPADVAGVDELETEYADVFGFENGGRVSLYEVEYGPGTLLTSTTDLADIAGFYRAFGLEKVDGERDRVDHCCVQLEFVSQLALRSAALKLEGDETGVEVVTDARATFLEDHLGRWVPRFAETVHDETDGTFYRELAALLDELVGADATSLDVEPAVFPEEPSEPMAAFTDDDGEGDFRCNACGGGGGGEPQSMPSVPPSKR